MEADLQSVRDCNQRSIAFAEGLDSSDPSIKTRTNKAVVSTPLRRSYRLIEMKFFSSTDSIFGRKMGRNWLG